MREMGAARKVVFILFVFTFAANVPCNCSLRCNVSDAGVHNTNVWGKLVMAHVLLSPGSYDLLEPEPKFERLTQAGKRNQYNLGGWLRERYRSILPLDYLPDFVLVRSSSSDRALQSAECVLSALFPPKGENLKDGFNWQPIPIHTLPQDQDEFLAAVLCERYESVLKKLKDSHEVKLVNIENWELYKNLSKLTGKEIGSIGDVAELYQALNDKTYKNETLPQWALYYFPEKLIKFSVLNYQIPTHTQELKRLKAGPFLKDISRHIEEKLNGSLQPNRSLFIYSLNEDTLANILNVLGTFNCLPLPRSAAVLLELWSSDEFRFSVTVSYKNETNGVPYLLKLPNCHHICPLHIFLDEIANYTPQDWKKECISDEEVSEIAVLKTACVFIGLIMITLIIILLRFCTFKTWGLQHTLLK